MSPNDGGARPTGRAAGPDRAKKPRSGHGAERRRSGAPKGNGGRSGTRGQRIRSEYGDDETIEAGRYRPRRERSFELPRAVVEELRSAAETDGRAGVSLERRLVNAAQAYERDRYKEALSAVKPVVDAAPRSAAARELYGLILYRLGRWRHAARELRYVHEMTGSFDQHPVIADCERAMGRLDRVNELWDELRTEGVDKQVLVEGRLVLAGALADAGEIDRAILVLQPAARHRRHADVPVLREWYALANLYELAGDLPRARELFARVATQAPDLLDAPERLRAIR
ncbi:MAG: tetratricopeptide repeat protein [Acidimicrobiales bacterium]